MTRLVAVFGIKYEPAWLVRDLKENLAPWVDDFAVVDCRSRRDELWIHEGRYRKLQRGAAIEAKADWVLVTSPDERWEDGAGDIIRPLIDGHKDKVIFNFPLREMWTPTAYRTDKLWGRKRRARLFPLLPNQRTSRSRIQAGPAPIGDGTYARETLDANIYHLKMIEPENRVMRAEVFEALDPDYHFQSRDPSRLTARRKELDPEGVLIEHGYHYLHNEDGLELEEIPEGRGFSPPYDRPYIFDVPPRLLRRKAAPRA